MAVFGIVYRNDDSVYGGRVTKVQAYNYTFTPNQEWVEFWNEGDLRAKLAVKAYDVLSIQTLDGDAESDDQL
jgi:hypothetical protein